MKALLLVRVLAPLCAAVPVIAGIWAVSPYMWPMFWVGLTIVLPVFIGACLLWRRRMVRDEATPPFVTVRARRPGAMRERPRKVITGVVISRKEIAR